MCESDIDLARYPQFFMWNQDRMELKTVCKMSQKFTVNQLSFAATLFRDCSVTNWLKASHFHN